MTASQDRIQSILQQVLEESLPLVHKGIFSPEELQTQMCARQKLQNNMLKTSAKLSDFLKAIQYEYSIERLRRFRIDTLSVSNPLFKKQSKTDFIVVRRIIKLWERTMFKFKYNVDLWKQFLDFCIKNQSKKQFYRALSSAIRFVPFSEDLWLIGINYQVQIGLNMWKARKLFFKCLKMNPTKHRLWLQMLKFEIQFLKVLHSREKAIQGGETMQFVHENDQQDDQENDHNELMDNKNDINNIDEKQINKFNGIKLDEHDDILLMVFEQAISKLSNKDKQIFLTQVNQLFKTSIKQQSNKELSTIIKRAYAKIQQKSSIKLEHVAKVEHKIQIQMQTKSTNRRTIDDKLQEYQQFMQANSQLELEQLDGILGQFVTKPRMMSILINIMLCQSVPHALKYLLSTNKFRLYNLQPTLISNILRSSLPFLTPGSSQQQQQQQFDYPKQVNRLISQIETSKYFACPELLQAVIACNLRMKNYKANNNIYRSVVVNGKKYPETVERCNAWIREGNCGE